MGLLVRLKLDLVSGSEVAKLAPERLRVLAVIGSHVVLDVG